MSHNEFDKKMKDAFDHMDDHDQAMALKAKERVWETLDIKPKKQKRRYWGLLWFLLGALLALGILYFGNSKSSIDNDREIPIAQNSDEQQWQLEMKEIKNSIVNLEQRNEAKNAVIDSIRLENERLLAQINTLTVLMQNQDYAEAPIKYVTDTIYSTKIEKEIIEQEKLVRDTIFIEVPILQEENDLMADLGNPETPNKSKKKGNKPSKKKRASSIQFNFNNSIEDK